METTRRGFLGAALALAAAATVPGTAKALSEDDAAKLARLLSTPGSVIRGQEFHIRRDVGLAELRDITMQDCKIYLYGDVSFIPAKCSNVVIEFCHITRVDGKEPVRLEPRNAVFRTRGYNQMVNNLAVAAPGDIIELVAPRSYRSPKLF